MEDQPILCIGSIVSRFSNFTSYEDVFIRGSNELNRLCENKAMYSSVALSVMFGKHHCTAQSRCSAGLRQIISVAPCPTHGRAILTDHNNEREDIV
jgi:hypothetical protein